MFVSQAVLSSSSLCGHFQKVESEFVTVFKIISKKEQGFNLVQSRGGLYDHKTKIRPLSKYAPPPGTYSYWLSGA